MKFIGAILIAALGSTLFASGQTNTIAMPFPALSLATANEVALERNWDLLTAKVGIDAATGQYIVTKEYPNPQLNVSVGYLNTHGTATSEGNGIWQRGYDTIVAVTQLVEIAGKRHNRQSAARAGIRGARARFYDAMRTLKQGVTKAYIAALLADYNERILSESTGMLKHEADIAASRFNAGDLSDSDLKQIQIGAEQFELQEAAAHAASIQARIQVEILMGIHQPKGDWTPTDSLEKLDSSIPPPPLPTNSAARPDVLAAEADLSSGQFNLRLAKAMRIPDPTFTVQYEHDPVPPGPPPDDTIGVGISFPLPIWNQNGGNIKAAQAAVEQYEFALGKIKAQSMADVANAQVEYREAYDRMQRYTKTIVPQSGKSRSAIAYAFEKGSATQVDLLEAERTDNNVRMSMAQSLSDTASAAADVVAARALISSTELDSTRK